MTVTAGDGKDLAKPELVSLTIDGQQVSVPKGTLVIRAAEQIGIQIPRFCDHPLLSPVGACRQCLVEVALPGPDGEPRTMMGPPGRVKPQASCTLVASDGMVVNTQLSSPIADKAQHGVMEQLLINHPLDCPVCDKGGECPLQNQAMSNGKPESRFAANGGVKRTFPKPINLSESVLLDRERCIVCQRCTRFSAEIAGDPFIALVERGAQQQIGIAEGVPFGSYFAGNTIQICPVGALTSADYRFRARPFDLVSTPSITEHDSSGAAIRVDHRRGKVMRRLAGDDPEVNEEWITDKDRFGFRWSSRPDRLTTPLIREDGVLRPASWPEAIAVAAAGLREAGKVGVLPGGRLTLEDAYAYSKFARTVLGTNDIDFRARPHSDEEAAFLATYVAAKPVDVTYRALEQAKRVVLVGLEPEDEAGIVFLRLRKATSRGVKVTAVASHLTRGLAKLNAELVQAAPGTEPAAIAALELDGDTVVLAGERLAAIPGAFSALAARLDATGARLAWVPRRAGDRGALDAGALPNLLPGGRPLSDAQARVDLGAAWGAQIPAEPGRDLASIVSSPQEYDALVFGGQLLGDFMTVSQIGDLLAHKPFTVVLEVRNHHVASYVGDVVFPVAPPVEKAGTFVNWEGRHRGFEKVLTESHALTDVRVLSELANEMGTPLGFNTAEGAYAEYAQLGVWDGEPAPFAGTAASAESGGADEFRLATWKQLVDLGVLQEGADAYLATARPSIALVSQGTHDRLGLAGSVTISNDLGAVTLPVEVAEIGDDTVWAPSNNGHHLMLQLGAAHGARVRLSRPETTPVSSHASDEEAAE